MQQWYPYVIVRLQEAHIQEAITASLMLTSVDTSGMPEIPTPVVKIVEGYDTEVDLFPINIVQTYIHYRGMYINCLFGVDLIAYIDKTHADYDHTVEYDMDSEDEEFVQTVNNNNGGKKVLTEDKFESMIDRFEKESEHHVCSQVVVWHGLVDMGFWPQGPLPIFEVLEKN